jgi:acyl-CoA thioester hydrolase
VVGGDAMTETRRRAHVERIPIRWGDMDAMDHVNNTVYFRFMQEARICGFGRLRMPEDARRSIGIVIANASCDYRRALAYPGTVEIRLFVGAPGGSGVPTGYELRREEEAQLRADDVATWVFVDMATRRPERISEAVRARLEGAGAAA